MRSSEGCVDAMLYQCECHKHCPRVWTWFEWRDRRGSASVCARTDTPANVRMEARRTLASRRRARPRLLPLACLVPYVHARPRPRPRPRCVRVGFACACLHSPLAFAVHTRIRTRRSHSPFALARTRVCKSEHAQPSRRTPHAPHCTPHSHTSRRLTRRGPRW